MTFDDFLEAFPDAKAPDKMGKGATAIMLRPGISGVVFHDLEGLDVTGVRLMVRVGDSITKYAQFVATIHEVLTELADYDCFDVREIMEEVGIIDFNGTLSPVTRDDGWKVSPLLTGDIFSVDVMRV